MEARIDKFLWSVRLFKTRAIAVDAIKHGKVTIGGMQVKGSREVKVGDVIEIRVGAAKRSFEVLQLAHTRMGAKLVPEHLKEVTPPDQQELIELARLAMQMNRPRGMGRPTKKERRDLDSYFGDSEPGVMLDWDFDDDDDDE